MNYCKSYHTKIIIICRDLIKKKRKKIIQSYTFHSNVTHFGSKNPDLVEQQIKAETSSVHNHRTKLKYKDKDFKKKTKKLKQEINKSNMKQKKLGKGNQPVQMWTVMAIRKMVMRPKKMTEWTRMEAPLVCMLPNSTTLFLPGI